MYLDQVIWESGVCKLALFFFHFVKFSWYENFLFWNLLNVLFSLRIKLIKVNGRTVTSLSGLISSLQSLKSVICNIDIKWSWYLIHVYKIFFFMINLPLASLSGIDYLWLKYMYTLFCLKSEVPINYISQSIEKSLLDSYFQSKNMWLKLCRPIHTSILIHIQEISNI